MSISFDLTIDDTRDQLARHARASLEAKPSLIGMSREEMAQALIKVGVPERQTKMRISQLWHWLYVRGVSDFADMRNISRICAPCWRSISPLRAQKWSRNRFRRTAPASGCSAFRRAVLVAPSKSKASTSLEEGRGTLCISSQVGCTLTCSFCHTGTQKLVRNLTSEEILAQLLTARDRQRFFLTRIRRTAQWCLPKAARSPIS